MVKHLTSILLALAAVFCYTMPARGDTSPEIKRPIPIKHVGIGSIIRDLSIPPLQVCYDGMSSAIHTTVTSDLGQIEMTVVNLSTGETWSNTFDSGAFMQNVLPISGTKGYYEIEYVTEFGDVYAGEFLIE